MDSPVALSSRILVKPQPEPYESVLVVLDEVMLPSF